MGMGEGEGMLGMETRKEMNLESLQQILASSVGDNIKSAERVILIANNPSIPNEVFATIGIGKYDFVVQFNLSIHNSWASHSRNFFIFQNNHLGSAWGFNKYGEPDAKVQGALHSKNAPCGIVFTSTFPTQVKNFLPQEIQKFAIPSRNFIEQYPNRHRGRNPSAGYYGYKLIMSLLRLANVKVPVYLIGFSGRIYSSGQATPHDWLFEQHVIQSDPDVIRVFCEDRSKAFGVSRGVESEEIIAQNSIPREKLEFEEIQGMAKLCSRREDILKFVRKGGVGVELGVAEGEFSERVLSQDHLLFLYGVDMYAGDRGHDDRQYTRALRRLQKYRNRHALIKMKFEDALNVFEDESLDFVYIDGYAHTGEDNGKHFQPWLRKLRSGGVLAGDDYSPSFKKVINAVDNFISQSGLPFFVIDCGESGSTWSKSPTWFTVKGMRSPVKNNK
jgi:hypothetical protein